MSNQKLKKYLLKKASETTGLGSRFFSWLERVLSDYTNVQSIGLIVAALSTGLVAVLYARVFKGFETVSLKLIKENPYLVLGASPILFLLAWWIVYRYAPEASGSGIPQVMSAIETEYKGPKVTFVDRLLSFKTAGIKIVSSLLCVAGGGAIGREGPTLQVSASIFHGFAKITRRFYPNIDEQTWIIAGASAGLASAFNTPLGGIVYAIEELGMQHFHRVRTALLSAVIVSGLVAQGLIGSYLYLGYPQLKTIRASGWPLVILVAVVTGLAGTYFSKAILSLSRKRRQLKSARALAVCAVIMGLMTAILVMSERYARGAGSELISDILFNNESATFEQIAIRLLGTAAAYLSGAAGGIFSPSLAIGAAIGSKIAFLFHSEYTRLFAMLGMIGFLTGVTHTPFTSFILVIEMSDRHSAIFPMMVTALVANGIAKTIQPKSFYENVKVDLLSANDKTALATE